MLSRARQDTAESQDDSAVQPYTEMQRTMMDDLEKRRHDWEQEMQRMQEDFFKVVNISSLIQCRMYQLCSLVTWL